jgi:SAM-dependent methyltransferase
LQNKDFYDDEIILKDYLEFRYSPQSPNESMEKPAFLELLGHVANQSVLDLGCGDAKFAHELFQMGCASYTGIEPSSLMLEYAKNHLSETNSTLEHNTIEHWPYPKEQFDVVISRLVFHYVEDLGTVFKNIYKTLKSDGRLVFSMVHPIITACDKARENNQERTSWMVDDYFREGARQVRMRNSIVTQFHRPLEHIVLALQHAGFQLLGFCEGQAKPEYFEDKNLYQRRIRIPLFLIISAKKNEQS